MWTVFRSFEKLKVEMNIKKSASVDRRNKIFLDIASKNILYDFHPDYRFLDTIQNIFFSKKRGRA